MKAGNGSTARLPEWGHRALRRASDPGDEEALLEAVNLAVRKFSEIESSDDAPLLEGFTNYCSALIDGPLAPHAHALSKLRQMRGFARARAFEKSGDVVELRSGVEDLSAAVDATPTGGDWGLTAVLAQALFRLGEQAGDVPTLRRSIKVFDSLPEDRALEPTTACARATAQMTIGGLTGDRQLVERAVLDLQSLIRRPGLAPATVALVEQNLVIALCANASQNRSARVYSQVLRYLQARLGPAKKTPRDEVLRMVQANARFELAKLTNDTQLVRRTELELGRLLKVFAAEPRRKLELLHQLGQSRFFRAVAQQSPALLQTAIGCLEEALALTSAEGVSDARHDRLLADLGHYCFRSSLLTDSVDMTRAARRHFETALANITIERAPGLYVQVAKGLFELHFRRNEYAEAATIADDIYEAMRFAQADPRLTAGVVAQGPMEIIGVPERHTLSLVRLGRLSEASLVIERTRGQNVSASIGRGIERDGQLTPEARRALDEARARLVEELGKTDERSIRRVWEDYLTLRRVYGLDLDSRPLDIARLAAAAPAEGALIQLCSTQAGSFALIWTRLLRDPALIHLPATAWREVSLILQGSPEGPASWVTEYERYLSEPSNADLGESVPCGWSDVIASCLHTLRTAFFGPIEAALRDLGLKRGAALLVCPPGALAQLPLSAALDEGGLALSNDWTVSIVPNAIAATTRPNREDQAQRMVCMHSPTGEPGSVLPHTRAEAMALKRLVPHCVEVFGDELRSSIALAALKGATHVHVACHGVYDPEKPTHSGLLLAEGERLTLTRLWAAGFETHAVRLVFLSCCEGGTTGRTIDSDEFVGLPAALLQLGADGVIAAQWAVVDDAARVFSEGFYRRYLDASGVPRVSPSRALLETRRWMRNVTVGGLIDEGYLSLVEATALFSTHASGMRGLRRYGSQNQQSRSLPGDDYGPLHRSLRPYSEACHWAGWSLFGQ